MMRLGVVDYFNALPLAHGLERELPEAKLLHATPARIADALERGELDVGLVPVATLLAHPSWKVVPGLGIASEGAVRSVLLISRVPVSRIKRLVMDPASRTSNLLAALWLKHAHGLDPDLVAGPAEAYLRLEAGDATVVIGNDALTGPEPDAVTVDLGEAWTTWTGLPFVFAVWAGPGAGDPELARGLERCYLANTGRLAELAGEAAGENPDRRILIESYLRDNIRYRLGPREEEGLGRYLELARTREPVVFPGPTGDPHVHSG